MRPGSALAQALRLLLFMLLAIPARAQTPPGTVIDNTALATYDVGGVLGLMTPSNTVSITTVAASTPSSVEFMAYAPGAPGAVLVSAALTECSSTGLPAGPFSPIAPPTTAGGAPIPVPGAVDLLGVAQYPLGDAVFVRLADPDQDLDASVADTVLLSLSIAATGDSELLRLTETGPGTGVFAGYIQSSGAAASPNDCVLEGAQDADVVASYVDALDPSDISSAIARLSPSSLAFDSSSGAPVSGATVTLVEDATNLPATVFGDDGVSLFPSSVVTGGTATDSGGALYTFAPGTYRFPIVPAGTYRLEVSPPPTLVYPSVAPTATLQSLPGAPFEIVTGSRGEPFVVATASTISIDVPLDPFSEELFLAKTANKSVIGRGELVQYNLRVRNPGSSAAPLGLELTDVLPFGFRYKPDSVRVDGLRAPEPTISPDGRTLVFPLPPAPSALYQNIRYVTEATSGAPIGPALNRARSLVIGGTESHFARAQVLVRDELLGERSFLMGQVVVGSCDAEVTNDREGLPGVRVYLDDGTYSITDDRGLFQFEGVRPGVHVVQMDLDTLRPSYEPVACEANTRFAGRSFSQFVDVRAGSVWRTDFHVQPRPPETGFVSLLLTSTFAGDTATHRVEIDGIVVPIRNLRVAVLLPEGSRYVPGSSVLDGRSIADPSASEGSLTYELDEQSGSWMHELELHAALPGDLPEDQRLVTSAYAVFETPTKKPERTPVVQNFSYPRSRSRSSIEFVEIRGLAAEEAPAAQPAAGEARATEPVYDAAWLGRAGPELQWLLPAPGSRPKIPSVHVWIKHPAVHRLTLLHNGRAVSPLSFEGQMRSPSGAAAISRWRGVDLVEGPNRFEVFATGASGDPQGRLERVVHYAGPPVSVELVPEASKPVADGRTPPVIAVRLRDRFGEPAREGVTGELRVEPPYETYDELTARQTRQLAGIEPGKPVYVVGADGIAQVRLRPTTESGSVQLRFGLDGGRQAGLRAWLEPEDRDWILVGLVEGTASYNTLSGNAESLDALGFEENLQTEQRLSLFAKGRVRGKWLLTLAYDSEAEDEEEKERLGGLIDPDSYYTLYGSKAEQSYEAPTSERLYLKIEREKFYALFGDYESALDVTELSRYNRGFTGFKSEYQGERFSLRSFAAETDQAFLRDEIQGDGTSGLYRLSRKDIVENSEKVALETRDRFRREVVLHREEQVRHVDYSIDFAAGTLFFRSPVPSKDEALNPIFIVVEYESESGEDASVIAGGRGAMSLGGDRVELGASAIREGTVGRDGELFGVDLRVDLDPATRFRAEAARTDAEEGLTPGRGAAYVAELTRSSGALDARAYYRTADPEFGLGQQSATVVGMRSFGAEARYRLTDSVELNGLAYRETNLETEAERDVLEGRADRRMGKVNLYGGLRFAKDRSEGQPDATSSQLIGGASYSMLDDRLRLRAGTEISLGGDDENVDFPSRVTLGGDLRLTPNVLAFAEQEFAFGEAIEAHETRVGLRSTPWTGGSVSTSLEQHMTESGNRTFANLGLRQTWQVLDRWSVDAGLDRTQTLKGPDAALLNPDAPPASGTLDDDFTALSFGSTYRADKWSWTTRVETRVGDQENKWGVFSGLYREVNEGLGYSLRLELNDANPEVGSHATAGNVRVGLAYRPLASRWLLLDRLDLSFDNERGGSFVFRNRKIVNNLALNYRWNRRLQISLLYGSRYQGETIEGEGFGGYTDLTAIEFRRDLGERWDLSGGLRMRHSYDSDLYEPSYGISLGYRLARNLWVSAGYNFTGFRDDDFSGAQYSAKGPFLRFRYKFDQETVRGFLEREGR